MTLGVQTPAAVPEIPVQSLLEHGAMPLAITRRYRGSPVVSAESRGRNVSIHFGHEDGLCFGAYCLSSHRFAASSKDLTEGTGPPRTGWSLSERGEEVAAGVARSRSAIQEAEPPV